MLTLQEHLAVLYEWPDTPVAHTLDDAGTRVGLAEVVTNGVVQWYLFRGYGSGPPLITIPALLPHRGPRLCDGFALSLSSRSVKLEGSHVWDAVYVDIKPLNDLGWLFKLVQGMGQLQ